jgi:hypothetical protein
VLTESGKKITVLFQEYNSHKKEVTLNESQNASDEKKNPHDVRIHIDQKPYNSPNPTMGADLYELGHVHSGFTLFREVTGNKEDPAIPNNETKVHLEEDEHFHSSKERPQRIHLIVQTLSGNFSRDFNTHTTLQRVVDRTFHHLHIVPAEGEVWELRYNDTVLNLQQTIEQAHLPNGAKLQLAPKEGGGG